MTEPMRVKPLVEGALLSAITVLMAVISLYLPIPLLNLVLPVPIIILVYRHSLNLGIMAAVVSAILTGILGNMPSQAVVMLVNGAVGLAMGEAMRQKYSPPKVLAVGTAAALIFGAAMFYLLTWVTGVNNFPLMIQQMEKSMEEAVNFYIRLGMDKAQLETFKQSYLTMIRLLIPSMVLASFLAVAIFSYWLARRVLRRLGQATPGFPPFSQWRFPRYLLLGFFISLLFYLVTAGYLRRQIFQMTALNLLLAFATVYLLQGLSVVWFYLEHFKVTGIVKALVVFLALSFPLATYLVVSIGLLDGWLNYRRL